MNTLDTDVAIIGSGTAGMAAYREATKYTDRVALIEGGEFGTTCARVGCMPSKLLIAPADARHRLSAFPEFGISANAGQVDGQAVMARVRRERDRFVGFVRDAVDGFEPRHLIRAHARFEDPFMLRLESPAPGQPEKVRADRIIITTGSRPSVPEMFKAAGDRLVVNDDIFEWKDLPESVAILGAGVIGLELGQALHRLGVRVRLFGRNGHIAGLTDPKVRDYAAATFAGEFPTHLDARRVSLAKEGDSVLVSYADTEGGVQTEAFSYVLVATGRTPNVDGLGLENTGLELDRRGLPIFDAQSMRAGDSHIFIAGDVNGDRPLLHEAADEGRLAGENAGRYPEVYKRARRTPLGIVFSDPQVALVGQRYADLKDAGIEFEAGEVSFEDQGRSRVMLVNRGLLRVYGEQQTGRLLGAEMIGPENEHLAHLLAWAIQARMTVGETLEMPFYHPVIEEGLRTALRNLLQALDMGSQPPLRCIDCGPGA